MTPSRTEELYHRLHQTKYEINVKSNQPGISRTPAAMGYLEPFQGCECGAKNRFEAVILMPAKCPVLAGDVAESFAMGKNQACPMRREVKGFQKGQLHFLTFSYPVPKLASGLDPKLGVGTPRQFPGHRAKKRAGTWGGGATSRGKVQGH
jgi:hypothetical protein